MSKIPFFSVLIPTKGRSHLVGYAIQSVLDQSFDDIEIVLVDNDDEEATKEAVQKFSDPRLRYFRSGGLNMSENWECALNHASGRFITVLEDKQTYYPWALKKLHDVIIEVNTDVVVWEWDTYHDQEGVASRKHHSGSVGIMSADEILDMYTNKVATAGRYMPRMLNSCASSEAIHKIKKHQNIERMFAEHSPDLCAAFYLLASIDTICFINDGLGLVGYTNLSNAVLNTVNGAEGEKYYGKSITLDYVPIKSTRLTYNTVYNDFLRIRRRVEGRLSSYVMSPLTYASMCLWDVSRMYFHGAGIGSTANEVRLIMRYLKAEKVGFYCYFKILLVVLPMMRQMLTKKTGSYFKYKWKAKNILNAAKQADSTLNIKLKMMHK